MTKNKQTNRIVYMLITSATLGLSYLLFGHLLFFLHKMRQWPFILFVFGLCIIVISTFFDARTISAAVVIGYISGFIIGEILGSTYYVYVGHDLWIARHNMWFIWTIVYLLCILLGLIWDILRKKLKNNKKKT